LKATVSKLGNAIDVLSGFAYEAELFNETEGLPVIRIRDVVRGFSKTRYSGDFDARFIVKNGEILIGMDGNFNTARWTGGPALLNQRVCKVTARADILDEGFLFHLLPKELKKIEDTTAFVTVKHLSVKGIRDIDIALPSLPEQRRIAAILDQADALRAKRREALAQLDILTQSVFIEMFGDPVRNPKKWQVIPFKEACDTKLGKMLDARQQTGLDKRSYLRNANVQWFRVDLIDLLEMDFDSDARKTFNLQKGDLLICEGGDPGRAAIWQGELEDVYFQKALHRGRPKLNVANSEYLVWLLWFLSHNGALGDHVTAATIAHLTGEKLKAMPIPVPPLALQQKFAIRLQSLDALKANHYGGLQQLNTLFASLQHRAFRGEL
jgi:type I restriction enzyme S subunit